jgi:hypothetical protein
MIRIVESRIGNPFGAPLNGRRRGEKEGSSVGVRFRSAESETGIISSRQQACFREVVILFVDRVVFVPRIKMPGLIKPQLATLKPKAPSRGDWLHEIKYDGYRVQIHELVMVSRCSSTQQN